MLVVKAKHTPLPNMDDLGMVLAHPGTSFCWAHIPMGPSFRSQQRHIEPHLVGSNRRFQGLKNLGVVEQGIPVYIV